VRRGRRTRRGACITAYYAPGAGELGELPRGGEDDERDVGIAQHGELLGLLEEAAAALGERDLPRRSALYPLYLPPLPRHPRRRSLSVDDAGTRPPSGEPQRQPSPVSTRFTRWRRWERARSSEANRRRESWCDAMGMRKERRGARGKAKERKERGFAPIGRSA